MLAVDRTFNRPKRTPSGIGVRTRAGIPTHLIHAVISLAAFGAWTNWGIDVGFQKLSPFQFLSIVAFTLTLLNGLAFPLRNLSIFVVILFPAFAVLVAAVSSMINATEIYDSIRFLGRYIYGLMFVFSIVALTSGHHRLSCHIVRMFIIGGCATTFICIAANYNSSLAGIVFDDLFNRRAQGFLSHPNQLAMLYLATVALLFWPNVFPFYLKILVFIPLIVGLLITGSKFNLALVALIVPILLIWLPMRERRQIAVLRNFIILVPLGVIFVSSAALIIQANSQIYYDRMVSFLDDPVGADTTSIRFLIWGKAYDCFEKHMVLGIGAGNAQECIPYSHAHNFIINFALEMGLIGLLSLVLFLVGGTILLMRANLSARRLFSLTKIGKPYRAAGVVMVALGGFMVSNLSSDSLGPATMPTLWILLGLAIQVYLLSTDPHGYSAK